MLSYLKAYKKATITLGDLEKLVLGDVTYTIFAENIRKLIDDNILIEKSPEANNGKEILLPYKFDVNRSICRSILI